MIRTKRSRGRWRLALEPLEARALPSLIAPATFGTGVAPYAVAIADVNGDALPDLITANYTGNTVSVLTGNGAGSFQPAVSYPAGATPYALAVADVNGDNLPDVVTANYQAGTVSVLLGTGEGSFQPPWPFPAGLG